RSRVAPETRGLAKTEKRTTQHVAVTVRAAECNALLQSRPPRLRVTVEGFDYAERCEHLRPCSTQFQRTTSRRRAEILSMRRAPPRCQIGHPRQALERMVAAWPELTQRSPQPLGAPHVTTFDQPPRRHAHVIQRVLQACLPGNLVRTPQFRLRPLDERQVV